MTRSQPNTDARRCAACRQPLEPGRTARARYHRAGGCKHRAWRRLRAGLPEDAYPDGRRGRVPLGEKTAAEQRAATFARMLGELDAASKAIRPRLPSLADLDHIYRERVMLDAVLQAFKDGGSDLADVERQLGIPAPELRRRLDELAEHWAIHARVVDELRKLGRRP